jgi:hypothetical protein
MSKGSRASTGGAAQVIARVDGRVVAPDALWWPAMNFGQFRWPAPVGAYELELPMAEFIELLDGAYRKCVAELQADDALVPDQSPSPLRDAGYPRLADLPDHPAALLEAVAVFLWDDLFGALMPFLPSPGARFMVNSVEAVSVSSPVVVIRGRGYHAAPGFAADPE